MIIIDDFPRPPARIRDSLAQLRIAHAGTAQQKEALGVPLAELPRPWLPASCPDAYRRVLWYWLDEVAAWLNRDYAWPADRVIPACWPLHPHIAHELAVLACLRIDAEAAFTPDLLEDWHRYSRPQFADRLKSQLGSSCQAGHTSWPARTRWIEFTREAERERRRARFELDTAEVQALFATIEQPPSWVDPETGLVDEAAYARATAGDTR